MPFTTLFSDEFVDPDGTSLAAHAAGWSVVTSGFVIASNRVRPNTNGAVATYTAASASGVGLSVSADLVLLTTSPTSRSGVLVTNGTAGYALNLTQIGSLQIQSVSGTGMTVLGTSIATYNAGTLTLGATYSIELQWDPNGVMRGYFNGSLVIPSTSPDTTYTGLTMGGIRENAGSAPTNSTAMHFERFAFAAAASPNGYRQRFGRGIGRGLARGLR